VVLETQTRGGSVQAYDFRRPNKFSRDHIRALQIVGETFARQFSTVLGTGLRSISSVNLHGVEQYSYDEYVHSLDNPACLSVLSFSPLSGAGLFQLEVELALTIVERLLGGSGDSPTAGRPLTSIEEHLVREVLQRGLREFDYAFESLLEIETTIVQQESNPQFAQIAAPSDMTVVLELDVKIGDQRGRGSFCMPYATLLPVLESFETQSMFAERDPTRQAEFSASLERALYDIPVNVSVRFHPIRLTSAQVMTLRPGDVIPLHHSVDAPLSGVVDDIVAFDATTGLRGKRLACRVVETRSSVG